MLTKGRFTRDEWNHLLRLFNVMSFSMFSCSHYSNLLSEPIGKLSAMSKGGQEATSSEGSPMAKPKPMIPAKAKPVKLVLRSPWSTKKNLSRICDIPSIRGKSMKDKEVKLGTRKLVQTTQSSEVEYSQVRRQDRAQNSNPWKQDDREVSSHSTSTRKFVQDCDSKDLSFKI